VIILGDFVGKRYYHYPAVTYWQVMAKFTLEEAMKARRESSFIFSIDLGPRWGWVVNITPRPFHPQQRHPVRIAQKDESDRGPV
jgi:hypothetical protein